MAEQQFSLTIQHVGQNQLLTIDNSLATMTLSLHGAHITSFIPKQDNRERLWMSPLNDLAATDSIRGGIPICWPWFADLRPENDTRLPMHGFLRTTQWQLQSITQQENQSTRVELSQEIDRAPGFPYSAKVTLEIFVADNLTVNLITRNTGNEMFPITAALHTYFAVNSVSDIAVTGIKGKYRDKTRGLQSFDAPEKYLIREEIDRIHTGEISDVVIVEKDTKTSLQNAGNDSVVIWNPGKKATESVANIPDDDYQKFLCIESAITQQKQMLAGETHTLTQQIS